MKNNSLTDLYKLFEEFIQKSIINSDSFLTDDKGIFTLKNIKECVKRYIDNPQEGKEKFEEKIKKQFNDPENPASNEVKIVFAHINWLWAFAVDDITINGKKKAVEICLDKPEDIKRINDNKFPIGFGSSGTFHKQNKYMEINFILKLLEYLKKNNFKNSSDVKSKIIEICLFQKYNLKSSGNDFSNFFEKIKKSCAMYNILLCLSDPEHYERIASDNHKNRIVESFDFLIPNSDNINTDEKIFEIRKLINIPNFDFYGNELISQIWNPVITDSEFNELQGLSIKKNIILYGPPGTGKTYTANSLAKSFIIQKIIKNNKTKLNNNDLVSFDKIVNDRIINLQLHSNYNYEDFIAGIRLINGETVAKEGFFLEKCNKISADNNKAPYVLILDEINRVDLARLFGEAFSGIENRNKNIDLTIGGFKISIPENLYIIGTMNEIDFSLERVDFALRRRFLWFQYGFNSNMLREIINKKIQEFKKLEDKIDIDQIEKFIVNAENINERIANLKELGKQYEIGHTFFSELIDITKEFFGRPGYKNKIDIYKSNGPCEVLWNISIEPIIQAFMGNLDETTKNDKIKEMRELFFYAEK
ncbi:MAG: AAA family ATPase [Candidatus Wallbacteria bacterium]